MEQLEIVNHEKHGTRNIKKSESGISYRFSRQTRSSLQLTTSMIVVAATAVPLILISIYINLPWLQFLWLEVVPSLWSLMCGIFTPRNLFILLNILILSIFVLAHLQNTTSSATSSAAPPSSRPQSVANDHSDHDRPNSDHDIYSGSTKLNEDDGGVVSIADDLQRGPDIDIAQHSRTNLLDLQYSPEIEIKPFKDGGAIIANHAFARRINGGDNQDDEAAAMVSIAASAGGYELLAESRRHAHLQLSAADKSMQLNHRSSDTDEEFTAAKAGGKAEKATSAGRPVEVDAFIDSLLAEKESIFTRAHAESRPLASARFTRKKATPSINDRPLSPLRTILKRGDTLEATWKAICESKRHSSPFNRHYPKHSGANENPRGGSSPSLLSPIKQRSKAARNMLHDDELTRPRLPRKREPSMPQEELNAKVESFISRFNAQIKIQREKSLLDFMEMVGRGAS